MESLELRGVQHVRYWRCTILGSIKRYFGRYSLGLHHDGRHVDIPTAKVTLGEVSPELEEFELM